MLLLHSGLSLPKNQKHNFQIPNPMSKLLDRFIPLIYIQISPEKLTLKNIKSGEVISEVPELAIAYEKNAHIVGTGNEAVFHRSKPSVKIINPFAHPRTLVSDFTVAEQLLKAMVNRLLGSSIFAVSPKIVLHPLGDPAGGFTQVELRAFREMAYGAGASQVVVWTGRTLTDLELSSGNFPNDGQVD